MTDYTEQQYSLVVPKASGVDGFLLAIRKILSLSRVQSILIDLNKVSYTRLIPPGEPTAPIEVDFTSLMPAFVIRTTTIIELPEETDAHVALGKLFRILALRGWYPIAFASGPRSDFWAWYLKTTGIDLGDMKDVLYGVQYLEDPNLPAEALFLCMGHTRGGALIDTRQCFKIPIPLQIPRTP